MIVTRKLHVPWMWMVVAQLPFAAQIFTMQINGTAMTFTYKKFIDNPALMIFVGSLAAFPYMIIGPAVSYISDRIWTKFGRRKPFTILPTLLYAFCICLLPLAPNFYVLVAILWISAIVGAVNNTFWPLSNEIIPTSQRGMGSAIHQFMVYVGVLLFYWIMVGRFNDIYFMGPIASTLSFLSLNGEKLTYWVCAPLFAFTAFVVALGVKELLPPTRQTMYNES